MASCHAPLFRCRFYAPLPITTFDTPILSPLDASHFHAITLFLAFVVCRIFAAYAMIYIFIDYIVIFAMAYKHAFSRRSARLERAVTRKVFMRRARDASAQRAPRGAHQLAVRAYLMPVLTRARYAARQRDDMRAQCCGAARHDTRAPRMRVICAFRAAACAMH